MIIYGVNESEEETLQEKSSKVHENIDENSLVRGCCRVSDDKQGGILPQAIKTPLQNSDHVAWVIRNARALRTTKRGLNLITWSAPTKQQRIDHRNAQKCKKRQLQQLRDICQSEPVKLFYLQQYTCQLRNGIYWIEGCCNHKVKIFQWLCPKHTP